MSWGLTCLLLWEPDQPVNPINRLVDGFDHSCRPSGSGRVGNHSGRSRAYRLLANPDLGRLGQNRTFGTCWFLSNRHIPCRCATTSTYLETVIKNVLSELSVS
jgi:hypothetical protein